MADQQTQLAAANAPPSSGGDSGGDSGIDNGRRRPQRTLVVYSGPTSLDRTKGKGGLYLDNMDYFVEHGISCPGEGVPYDRPGAGRGREADYEDDLDAAEPVSVRYAFVLTREVADRYSAPGGRLAEKIRECRGVGERALSHDEEKHPFIHVFVREDRCYDMESIRTVLTEIDVSAHYDNLLFLNCGLVGPRFGPGTPTHVPLSPFGDRYAKLHGQPQQRHEKVPYSHWSQLYTSRLTDSVKLVGHSINTHFHTFSPHVQSFLYAVRSETIPVLVKKCGAIYDCGMKRGRLSEYSKERFEIVERYEVGMSKCILECGYEIAAAFVNRYVFGEAMVYDKETTRGMELDDTMSDIWYEEQIRKLTSMMPRTTRKWWRDNLGSPEEDEDEDEEDAFARHQWDVLPWDHFLFFKVSRFVPKDVQKLMNYNEAELEAYGISVVPNDARDWLKARSWLNRSRRREALKAGLALLLMLVVLRLARRRCVIAWKRRVGGLLQSPRRSRAQGWPLGLLLLKREKSRNYDR
ncbi:hypothetical protein ACHAWF_001365 [Thalassiosira exigua]